MSWEYEVLMESKKEKDWNSFESKAITRVGQQLFIVKTN